MKTVTTELLTKEGTVVAVVELPVLREGLCYDECPNIVRYQDRYFAANDETGDYIEGDFYGVPS